MSFTPAYIASFEENTGLFTYSEPFLAPEKAFPVIEDAYVWRGRVKRREGFTLLGRLQRTFTDASLGNSGVSPWTFTIYTTLASPNTITGEPDAQIKPGSVTITIQAGPDIVFTDNGDGTLSSVTPGNSGTINYVTGSVTLTHTAGAGVATIITFSYWPGLPVMGLRRRELDSINDEQYIMFDRKYSYSFSGGSFNNLSSTLFTTWTGQDYDLFWTTNFQKDATGPLMWATNNVAGLHGYNITNFGGAAAGPPSTVQVTTSVANSLQIGDTVYFVNVTGGGAANNLLTATVTVAGNPFTCSNPGTGVFVNGVPTTGIVVTPDRNIAGDGIRRYNGTTWKNFNPVLNPSTVLMGCLCMVPYKGRLLCFNTIEGNNVTPTGTRFPNRVRYSQDGDVLDLTLGWREDVVGRGGFINAPTNEQIISVEYIKDSLIVKFERSSWKLIFVESSIDFPFIWQKINTELGAESTFSLIPFDRGVLSVGNVGITTDDSINVSRNDEQIPNYVFKILNKENGPKRVFGIRDFYRELVYWSYPDTNTSKKFPNKVLVYNYINNSYAVFNDSYTCYGYYQRDSDITWSTLPYKTWDDWQQSWDAGALQSKFPDIIAGNQQGFVELLDDSNANDFSLAIKSMTFDPSNPLQVVIMNHNLQNDMIIEIDDCVGTTSVLNANIFKVNVIDQDTITLQQYDSGTRTFATVILDVGNTYLGGGVVLVRNGINIQTKVFAPYYNEAGQCRLGYVDFLTDITPNGEVTVNLYVDENNSTPINDPSVNTSVLGSNVVLTRPESSTIIPFQQTQRKIWHRLFAQAVCQNFQLQISLTPLQIANTQIAESNYILHAIALYLDKNSRLVQ